MLDPNNTQERVREALGDELMKNIDELAKAIVVYGNVEAVRIALQMFAISSQTSMMAVLKKALDDVVKNLGSK